MALFSLSLIVYFNNIDSPIPSWQCIFTSFLSQCSLCSLSIWALFTIHAVWTHGDSTSHRPPSPYGSGHEEESITFTKDQNKTHKMRLLSNGDQHHPLRYDSSSTHPGGLSSEHHPDSTPRIALQTVRRHHCIAWPLIIVLTFYPFIINMARYPDRSASDNACWITSDEDTDAVFGISFYWLLIAVILFLSLFMLQIITRCILHGAGYWSQFCGVILLFIVCMLMPSIAGIRSLVDDDAPTDDLTDRLSDIAISIYGLLTVTAWFNHQSFKSLLIDCLKRIRSEQDDDIDIHPPSTVRALFEVYWSSTMMAFGCNISSGSNAEDQVQRQLIREILSTNPAPKRDPDLREHPHDHTNLFSEYTYCYQFPVMLKGSKQVIELSDLSAPPRILQVDFVYQHFLKTLVVKHAPNCTFTFDVLWTLIYFNKGMIAIIVLSNVCAELCEIGGVIAFRELLNFLYTDDPLYYGLLCAGGIALSKFGAYIFTARGWVTGDRAGIGARNLLMGLILRKALLIPQYDLARHGASRTKEGGGGSQPVGDESRSENNDHDQQPQRESLSTGQIVNTMSNDTERINNLFKMGVVAVGCGMNIFICLSFMIWLIGVEALGGFAIGILLIPFNIYFGKLIGRLKLKALVFSDERVKFLTELLNGIRVVKMYCWEQPLQHTIAEWRRQEIGGFRWVYNVRAVLTTGLAYCDYVIIVAIMGLKVAMGHPINVVEIYLVISLTNTIRSALNKVGYIGQLIDGLVAILRIQAFFDIEDHYLSRREQKKGQSAGRMDAFAPLKAQNGHNGYHQLDGLETKNKNAFAAEKAEQKSDDDVLIEIRNARFEHEPGLALNRLHVGQLEIRRNELIAVIGSVGSGKSMLIQSLLLETFHDADSNAVFKFHENAMKFAWVNQSFFIMNGTIRENILMNNAFDAEDYNAVLEASSLGYDLKLFAAGDETEIGEKGINLSGGQRARVCIARALYEHRHNDDVDMLLFDDSLSAVDNDVAQQIFRGAILEMAANTTRVVIMNSHLHFLEHFDRIIVMEYVDEESHCRVVENTTDLGMLRGKYAGLLQESVQREEARKLQDAEQMEVNARRKRTDSVPDAAEQVMADRIREEIVRKTSVYEETDGEGSLLTSLVDIDEMQKHKQGALSKSEFAEMAKLISEEDRVRGKLEGSSLMEYLNASTSLIDNGFVVFLLLTVFYMLTQCISVAFDISLSWWGSAGDPDTESSDSNWSPWFDAESVSDSRWLISSAIFVVAILVVGLFRAVMLFNLSLSASQSFEQDILHQVLHATIAYFDATPIGRITNRFSRDLAIIDSEMPVTMEMIALRLSIFVSYIITLSVFIPYYMLIVLPSFLLLVKLRAFYIKSVREIKRIDGITRSPLYNIFNECLFGAQTIRAFGYEQYFITKLEKQINMNTRALFDFNVIARFFAIVLEFIVSFQALFIAVAVVLLREQLPPNIAGLCITYSLSFAGAFQYVIRLTAELETQLTAVERLHAFSRIEQEPEYENGYLREQHVDGVWPTSGRVEFRNLKLKYRDNLPYVLRGVSCEIPSGSKIGICGRTGAGKSSIMVCLFRLFEFDADGGAEGIFIDGLNTSKIGLFALRSNICIIPQEPVLLSGSLRFNLDPFDRYHDDEIVDALKQVFLWDFIREKADTIHYQIAENGSNLSKGQRQLICISRALLQKPRILLLDEATSNIDYANDQLIQQSIRNNFDQDCTILTIAHRLDTIMDSDKIMVLDKGKLIQFDSPKNLLSDEQGAFYSLYNSKI